MHFIINENVKLNDCKKNLKIWSRPGLSSEEKIEPRSKGLRLMKQSTVYATMNPTICAASHMRTKQYVLNFIDSMYFCYHTHFIFCIWS